MGMYREMTIASINEEAIIEEGKMADKFNKSKVGEYMNTFLVWLKKQWEKFTQAITNVIDKYKVDKKTGDIIKKKASEPAKEPTDDEKLLSIIKDGKYYIGKNNAATNLKNILAKAFLSEKDENISKADLMDKILEGKSLNEFIRYEFFDEVEVKAFPLPSKVADSVYSTSQNPSKFIKDCENAAKVLINGAKEMGKSEEDTTQYKIVVGIITDISNTLLSLIKHDVSVDVKIKNLIINLNNRDATADKEE